MSLPVALITAVATQVLCQLFKVFYYSSRDRQFSFKYFFTAGGMPSSHSAFVTALAVSVGMHGGFTSDVFAAVAVFGFIVMYDAYRLRGTVEKQSRIIKKLLAERAEQNKAAIDIELPDMIGHTVGEIAAGIVVGLILGGALTLLLIHL
ncbi:MAG TPA: divergent PAP2 family protein [Spirochaetia bacterium]|nr:divergent PAP2 family protein [Spirochaetia bacterium]